MKKKYNILIIFVITLLVLFFSMKDDYKTIINTIVNIKKTYLIIGFVLVIFYWFLSAIVIWVMARNFKKNYSFRNAFKLLLRTNFFNAVTPFSTGGQPYQVYALKKDKIKIADSTNIIIDCFITYQIALVLLGIVALTSNYYFNIFSNNGLLTKLITLGFIVNTFVIIMLFILTFTTKMSKFLVNIIIKLLSKTKIVKNKEKTIIDFERYLREFHEGAKILLKNKKQFFGCIFLQLMSLISLYLVPFALICGIDIQINSLIVIMSSAYVMLIGSFVPIPGGTGGLEYGFIVFFSNFVLGSKVNAIMLLWRFITYYFGMIVGAISLSFGKKENK